MELNDKHIEILNNVREALRNESAAHYQICTNIMIQRNEAVLRGESRAEYDQLTNAIALSLSKFITMRGYLRDALDMQSVPSQDTVQLARLAWLDRMIETRKIS